LCQRGRRHLRHRYRVRGEIKPLFAMEQGTLRSIAAGIALTVVVSSLFHALSLGSANVVVPI
jgi:hypothetical protein